MSKTKNGKAVAAKAAKVAEVSAAPAETKAKTVEKAEAKPVAKHPVTLDKRFVHPRPERKED